MKIVIDARMYGLEHAGIGRYVLNLIKQLEKLDKKNDYFLLLRKNYFKRLNFKNKKFNKTLADIPHYSLKEQLFLPGIIKKIEPDLVHFPHFNVPILYRGKYIVTIHDLIKHQSKGRETTTRQAPLYWLKYIAYKMIINQAIKKAHKIITPSNYWKKELLKKYSLNPKKIIVTHEGAGEFLKKKPSLTPEKTLKKYGVTKPFVIYTGSLYPHKNVLNLVKAIQILNEKQKTNLSLVIASARNVFLERFKKEVEEIKGLNVVLLAGFVPDEELISLYQQAEAFVTPSLLEGFGLPGLEAMATKLPVVSSNASCLPEIYGNAAVYFNPLNINDMAKKIDKVISHEKIKQELKEKGLKQVKKYSWKKMATETLKAYK